MKVNTIDVAGLKTDRDQIWAEAVHLYRSGEKWWFTEQEEDILDMVEDEQEARRQRHPWEELFRRELDGVCVTSVNEILAEILHLPREKWASCATQVAKSLKSAGWYRTQRPRPSREWVYLRAGHRFGADGRVVDSDGQPVKEQPMAPRVASEAGMCVDDDTIQDLLDQEFAATPPPSTARGYLRRAIVGPESKSGIEIETESGEMVVRGCTAETLAALGLSGSFPAGEWFDVDPIPLSLTVAANGDVIDAQNAHAMH